jgi:uncharacterized protein
MEMTGEQLIPAPQQEVWDALNDPAVLKACVPGCESIEPTGTNEYQVLMVARVGPVSAKFKGKLRLSDIRPPHSYALAFEGQGGAAGFAKGGAKVRLAAEESQTRLHYDVKANVGGKLAQIGSRLVDAAAKKVADDFFRAFSEKLSRPHPAQEAHQDHPAPVPRDPDLPTTSETTLMFVAAGTLVVFFVSLAILL